MASKLVPVTGALFDDTWPHVVDLIKGALSHGSTLVTLEDVWSGIREKRYQLWVVFEDKVKAAVVTEMKENAGRRVSQIFICVGVGRKEWIRHLATIEAWAKAEGCDVNKALARPGWEPDLKKMGYTKTHVQMEKKL